MLVLLKKAQKPGDDKTGDLFLETQTPVKATVRKDGVTVSAHTRRIKHKSGDDSGTETPSKALEVRKNAVGRRYALVQDGDTYSVWAECSNYSSHVRGGISKTWRYVDRGMTRKDAEKLFDRRLRGKAK